MVLPFNCHHSGTVMAASIFSQSTNTTQSYFFCLSFKVDQKRLFRKRIKKIFGEGEILVSSEPNVFEAVISIFHTFSPLSLSCRGRPYLIDYPSSFSKHQHRTQTDKNFFFQEWVKKRTTTKIRLHRFSAFSR